MRKTGEAIEQDVYQMVSNSILSQEIDGDVYQYGAHPKGSMREDIVVQFVNGQEGQIQRGNVDVFIYVPNHEFDGALLKNVNRCRILSDKANEWAYSLAAAGSGYTFSLVNTITTVADEVLPQHVVTVRLQYNLATI